VGDHAAGAIWDASIVKIILGGTPAARDLQDLSALIGERDEHTDPISVGDYGSRSLQRSTRRVPVMPPETIRTLPIGTALVLLRSAAPLVTDLRPWTAPPRRCSSAEIGLVSSQRSAADDSAPRETMLTGSRPRHAPTSHTSSADCSSLSARLPPR
jgi:hypothetical protein